MAVLFDSLWSALSCPYRSLEIARGWYGLLDENVSSSRNWLCLVVDALRSCAARFSDRDWKKETKTYQATPDSKGVYEVGDDVSAPKVLLAVDPEYTDTARKKKMSGNCVIGLVVDAQGNPQDIHVAKSLAETYEPKLKKIAEGLDQTAMKAVSQYRFKPGEYQGKPVPVYEKIEIRFQIY